MKKISVLLKLSYKFSKRYMAGYLSALTKPILFAILGVLLLFSVHINTAFVLLSLLSIPCLCYSFWKGYVITYGLISCAHNFIKSNSQTFDIYSIEAKKQEVPFAKYVCFVAILTMLLYTPSAIYIVKTVPFDIGLFLDATNLTKYTKTIDGVFFINTIILAPFLNYALCAYYYKKDKENYFDLFINCFKKLDFIGLLIALIITFISYKGGVIYLILALILNPFVYSINTMWYLSKVEK